MNSLKQAKTNLQSQIVPARLPCREREFDQIFDFILCKLEQGVGGCMYLAGVPGTGKTATVKGVRRTIEENKTKLKNKMKMKFKFIEINGLKLTDPHQCYSQIYYEMFGKRVGPHKAETELNSIFNEPHQKDEFIILIVDELDSLHTKKQDILYHLFDWPCRPNSKLLVIAIANTLDLPERMMDKRVVSRAGFDRLDFQPYKHQDLQQIVAARLQGTRNVFKSDGIQLIARKVASISGDARKVLDICRRSIEIAEKELESSKKKTAEVRMDHVQQALKETTSSPKIIFIKNASDFQKHLLNSITTHFRNSGREEGPCNEIYSYFTDICASEGITDTTFSEFLEIAQTLHESRLILLEPAKVDSQKRIRLIVSTDDIDFALAMDKRSKNV